MSDERKVAASNQAPSKKRYIALVGLNFDGLKNKPRVESGKPIPDGLDAKEIAQLLRDGHIKEA